MHGSLRFSTNTPFWALEFCVKSLHINSFQTSPGGIVGANSNIEWTRGDDGSRGYTWNPVDGCTRVSEGCRHCYIERQTSFRVAHRRFDGARIGATTGVLLHPRRLIAPLGWSKPSRVFVCSMADLFHASVPEGYIAQIFAVMALAPQHTFQVLTKRHDRMRSVLQGCAHSGAHSPGVDFRSAMAWAVSKANPNRLTGIPDDAEHQVLHETPWPLPNVWLGVSTEDQKHADLRIPTLLDTPAAVRWISAEPLLGAIDLTDYTIRSRPVTDDVLDAPIGAEVFGMVRSGDHYWDRKTGLDWVVVGGESGPGARPMHPDWARSLRDQCVSAGIPYFFKQWGEFVPETHPACVNEDGHRFGGMGAVGLNGERLDVRLGNLLPSNAECIRRVGKKRAGRELDGRIWEQFPVAAGAEGPVGADEHAPDEPVREVKL